MCSKSASYLWKDLIVFTFPRNSVVLQKIVKYYVVNVIVKLISVCLKPAWKESFLAWGYLWILIEGSFFTNASFTTSASPISFHLALFTGVSFDPFEHQKNFTTAAVTSQKKTAISDTLELGVHRHTAGDIWASNKSKKKTDWMFIRDSNYLRKK